MPNYSQQSHADQPHRAHAVTCFPSRPLSLEFHERSRPTRVVAAASSGLWTSRGGPTPSGRKCAARNLHRRMVSRDTVTVPSPRREFGETHTPAYLSPLPDDVGCISLDPATITHILPLAGKTTGHPLLRSCQMRLGHHRRSPQDHVHRRRLLYPLSPSWKQMETSLD